MKKCSVVDCENKTCAKGLCEKHYRRLKKTGKLETKRDVTTFVYRKDVEKCSFPGCENKTKSCGLCSNHYKQRQKYGKPGSTLNNRDGVCSVEGCENKIHALRLCLIHYQKTRKYGNPLTVKNLPHTDICIDCGKEIKSSSLGRCRNCYYSFKVSTDEVYKHKMNARNHRRRSAKLSVVSEKYTKESVIEKTNGVCHICGEKIDFSLKAPNRLSFSIDHVIPLTKGGNDTLDNVLPAHRACNSAKSNR